MPLNDKHLISLVQANKELYDKGNPFYKFQERKKLIWETIGKELRTSSELCKRRWLALRDRYGREARKTEALSISEAEYLKPWNLLESMTFLRPHVIPRPTKCSQNVSPEVALLIPTISYSMPSPSSPECIEVDSPSPSTSGAEASSPSLAPPQSQQARGKKRARSAEVENGILEVIKLLKKRFFEEDNKSNIPADLFGKMIGSMVAKMSATKQARAMQRILEVTFEIEQESE
ncbi:transcription factor Adf-1-like [Anastrepha ludens]|uniref:transcription factor Adf-1-like n=1 Tax=Anastrepha ludens TaxID=28586 RepID=UPI0023AECD25|nr:transcription factor Adf-1-like [Anastrepha ludens]